MFPNFDTEGNHVKAMLDRTILLPVMLFAGVCCCGVSAGVPADGSGRDGVYGTLLIDGSVSPEVTPVEYGFHYEEIGMMGEGALHAELVRNRSFEEATPPADLSVRNGLYQDVPAPRGKNKKVYRADPLTGWLTFPVSHSPVRMDLTDEKPLNGANTYSLEVEVTPDIADYGEAAIVNKGYFGMNLKKGTGYRLSFFVRSGGKPGRLEIYLTDSGGHRISRKYPVDFRGEEWSRKELLISAVEDDPRGMLAIHPATGGKFYLDMVSLMPEDTWDGGKSVFRSDIMENLKEYAPDFIRFPGGCIVHGVNEATMYRWKKTIGPQEERPGQWSKWAPYYRTDGIGYHEFYELCEYLGADAMYVVPTGMVCTGWVPQVSPWNFRQPEVDVESYIQDALDAIEYAIGGTDTEWGALRAANGHPEPFPLKYVEIGNEDFGPVYWERYSMFYKALHDRYPDLVYIANSIIGAENEDKRKDIASFPDPSQVKVFDEHLYYDVEWACRNHYRFDGYRRGVADLFIGELGISGRYPENALATCAVRMSMERNGDLNPLLAERPLMRHWDFSGYRKSGPMLQNGTASSVKTAWFHLSKMFRDNKIDRYIKSGVKDFSGQQQVFATMGYDSAAGEYVLKLLNISDKTMILDTEVSGFPGKVDADVCLLDLSIRKDNTPADPGCVAPVRSSCRLDLAGHIEVAPLSLAIYRFK